MSGIKAIKFGGAITSLSSRADRSLRLSVVTPELSSKERALFMEYQNVNSDFLVEPIDEHDGVIDIEAEYEGKTPSQRLRAVIFILWKQKGEKGSFNTFYEQVMEAAINKVKEKLE